MLLVNYWSDLIVQVPCRPEDIDSPTSGSGGRGQGTPGLPSGWMNFKDLELLTGRINSMGTF